MVSLIERLPVLKTLSMFMFVMALDGTVYIVLVVWMRRAPAFVRLLVLEISFVRVCPAVVLGVSCALI